MEVITLDYPERTLKLKTCHYKRRETHREEEIKAHEGRSRDWREMATSPGPWSFQKLQEVGSKSLLQPSEWECPVHTLTLALLASRMVRINFCRFLSHVGGNLLEQLQEITPPAFSISQLPYLEHIS